MKNITISLPNDVYKKARIKAAEQDTSLSGLVRDLLTRATEAEEIESGSLRRKRAIQAILAEIHESQRTRGEYFDASHRLSRDEIHDRKALR